MPAKIQPVTTCKPKTHVGLMVFDFHPPHLPHVCLLSSYLSLSWLLSDLQKEEERDTDFL